MKEGEVDTKIELEKFQLFERINQVLTNAREIRSLMNTYGTEMMKKNYLQLLEILKNVSKAGKILHDCVRSLYENYNTALENVEKLTIECHEIIQKLFSFKFPNEIFHDNFFESPEVLIGESLRETLQNMITIGEKVISIIDKFSYNKYDKEDVSKIKKLLNTIKN